MSRAPSPTKHGLKDASESEHGKPPWSPMPFTGGRGGGKLSRDERVAYFDHLNEHPEGPRYLAGFHRPSAQTAEAIWSLLAPRLKLKLDDLLLAPSLRFPRDELTVKQALVVAIDAAVRAGERGRMLTTNTVFDALARHWSDHYRAAVEAQRADVSYDMKVTTVRSAWRDLLRNGVRLDALWAKVRRGHPELYVTTRASGRGHPRGRTVRLTEDASLFLEFVSLVKASPDYHQSTSRERLLLSDQLLPERPVARRVAGEVHYNIAEPGPISLELMKRLEAARFFLDVRRFLGDVAWHKKTANDIRYILEDDYAVDPAKSPARRRGQTWKRRLSPRQVQLLHVKRTDIPRVEGLVGAYDRERGRLLQLQEIRDRLRELGLKDGYVEIKSGFYKLINRRYQPSHFWPAEVTGKDVEPISGVIEWNTDDDAPDIAWVTASARGRWFKAEWRGEQQSLISIDVSTSQLQILAVFLGLDALEAEVTRRSFKEVLAQRAWDRHLDPQDAFTLPTRTGTDPFDGPIDERLRAAVKHAVMTHLYGSKLEQVAYRLNESPNAYGPGLGSARNIERLIDGVETLHDVVRVFLPAGETIADIAYARDPCTGVTFTDPYDGALVRWNPLARRQKAVSSGPTRLYIRPPAAPAMAGGQYPVDKSKLRRVVAPMLTHMLDAMFASFVVEQLNARGVRDVASVHDCWMVAEGAYPLLREAFDAAAEPWLTALGSVYEDLISYLGDHGVYGPWVNELHAKWRQRVADGRWPRFSAGTNELVQDEWAKRTGSRIS